MSNYEIIIEGGWRRRWTASEKLRIIEETLEENPNSWSWRSAEPDEALKNAV
ncbi:hypothetical protein [Thioclava nitratireducens]|uniref:hypothetical protein n=1 Tax=Thioclava nitratireducens TaxID=1915078 RepID=UPI0024810CDC|nr:hypothetical protein [Thioclava nitratireducens]WGT50409.1 hypothetical protein P0N61_19280 [Thioclava nitratireducens]